MHLSVGQLCNRYAPTAAQFEIHRLAGAIYCAIQIGPDDKPLLLCPYVGSDSTIAQIASEVLALTTISWNSTQMNQKPPIPIRAARAVLCGHARLAEASPQRREHKSEF
jgi:hypothetical protein